LDAKEVIYVDGFCLYILVLLLLGSDWRMAASVPEDFLTSFSREMLQVGAEAAYLDNETLAETRLQQDTRRDFPMLSHTAPRLCG